VSAIKVVEKIYFILKMGLVAFLLTFLLIDRGFILVFLQGSFATNYFLPIFWMYVLALTPLIYLIVKIHSENDLKIGFALFNIALIPRFIAIEGIKLTIQ